MLFHQQKTLVRLLARAVLHFHLIRDMLDSQYIEHTTEVSPYRVLHRIPTAGQTLKGFENVLLGN